MSRAVPIFAILILTGFLSAQTHQLPQQVADCLKKHPDVELDSGQHPAYLEVHFDRSSRPDYIVAVTYPKNSRSRALVCKADGTSLILGARSAAKPFSDMHDDNYMSSKWQMCDTACVLDLRKYYPNVPVPANESVCLTWEDGEGLIYWEGDGFAWKSLHPQSGYPR
jgi:hypothetical protein